MCSVVLVCLFILRGQGEDFSGDHLAEKERKKERLREGEKEKERDRKRARERERDREAVLPARIAGRDAGLVLCSLRMRAAGETDGDEGRSGVTEEGEINEGEGGGHRKANKSASAGKLTQACKTDF